MTEPKRFIEEREIYVYVSGVPSVMPRKMLYPPERMAQIMKCGSDTLKRQKYRAWELLEHAFDEAFSKNLTELGLRKTECGKWVSDLGYYFSISHCEKAVAVAVSKIPVGVDIEEKKGVRERLEEKILTGAELSEFDTLPYGERNNYLLRKWTVKESIFKIGGEGVFRPSEISAEDFYTETENLILGGAKLIISVSSSERASFVFNFEDAL